MTTDMPVETAAPRVGADSGTLSSAQADSFKGFEDFGSIRSSMNDTTSSTALPGLELMDSTSAAQNPGDGERRNDRPILQPQPGNELPDPVLEPKPNGLQEGQKDNRNKPPIDDGNKPDPTGDGSRQGPQR